MSMLKTWPRGAAVMLSIALCTGPVLADSISGAIYTSVSGGATVNGNNYEFQDQVYLNGGPNNPQCNSGSLSPGDYYFQVTDPSGATLLSTDAITNRAFTVSGGVITAHSGTHDIANNSGLCGGISIRLIPYLNTPNNGGVYKVWVTRVADFAAFCVTASCGEAGNPASLAGFVPGHIKTDNFRVARTDVPPPPPETETGDLEVYKFYDKNANGIWNSGSPDFEPALAGWQMTLFPPPAGDLKLTNGGGLAQWLALPIGNYAVTEGMSIVGNWVQSGAWVNGVSVGAVNPVAVEVVANQTALVEFGNYCTLPSNGRTLGFWSNKNGQALFGADDLAQMVALNLRNANGTHFNPTTYNGSPVATAFRPWLLGANATNMAYMLSAQLAAMQLNVYNGLVDGNSFYIPYGQTINHLIGAANTSLGDYGFTPASNVPGNQRAPQELLKNHLDALNNGASVVPAQPCVFRFQ